MHAIARLSSTSANSPTSPTLAVSPSNRLSAGPISRHAWRLVAVAGLGLSVLAGCQAGKECCGSCDVDMTAANPAAAAEGTADAASMGGAKPGEAAKSGEASVVEGKPTEGMSEEVKPADMQMGELSPATNVATDAKPADVKSAEARPAKVKTAEPKPAAAAVKKAAPAPVAAVTNEVKAEGRSIVEQYAALGYRQDWVGYAPVQPGAKTSFVVPMGNLLIVQDSQNAIAGLNTTTGASKWSLLVGDRTTAFVGHLRYNNRILAISDSEIFVLEPESGEILSRQRLAAVVSTAPAVVGSTLVFGTVNRQAFAHNIANGQRAWGYITGSAVMSKPAVLSDNCVGVVAQNGNVLILDALSGTSTGMARISGGMLNDAVASGETLYVASEDQSIYAFERIGGKQKWRRRTDAAISAQPVIDGNRMYITLASTGLHALDINTGKDVWVSEKATGDVLGLRTGSSGDRLLVWNGTNVQVVDAKNGDLIESIALPDVSKLVTDKFKDGSLYSVSSKGKVVKLVTR